MVTTRRSLPQPGTSLLLTDGGIETDLIFRSGWDLPSFAAFVLLEDRAGRDALRAYYRPYQRIARDAGFGLVLETPTWRASRDWAGPLGYDARQLERMNRSGVELLHELREQKDVGALLVLISGCLGPRTDGFHPRSVLGADQAESYHTPQVRALASSGADLVTALTLAYPAEAIGITRAAMKADVPVVISFTVETDGRLPNGCTLQEAVLEVDAATVRGPAYYMVNCAHFSHLHNTFQTSAGASTDWRSRIGGVRANASERSHAELDAATELDDGDPTTFGSQAARLRAELPSLAVLGGCCGTDSRHLQAVASALTAEAGAEPPYA